MSWQCPNCETINQDITPICTVCDHLSPVVDSFLSLESIEKLRDYNDKLEEVHALEIEGRYEDMLKSSIQAMALFRDNSLAIEKAYQAIKRLQKSNLEGLLFSMIDEALNKKNLNLSAAILKLIDLLEISNDRVEEIRKEVKKKISRKKDVDEILQKTHLALIDLDTDGALRIVEEGLIIHTSSKRLQTRRKEIQTFIQNLNKRKNPEDPYKRKRPLPKQSSNRSTSVCLETDKIEKKEIEPQKRKFPKVKLNN